MLTRSIEHQEDRMAGKWEASGATEHSKICHGQFNWLHPKTLAKFFNIHKGTLNKGIVRNKKFRDKSRIRQIHQNVK